MMTQQNGDTESSRLLSIRVSASTHRLLRIRVAEEDTSIQQWVEALIERELGIPAATDRPLTQANKGSATR